LSEAIFETVARKVDSEEKLHNVDAQIRRDSDSQTQATQVRESLVGVQDRARLSGSLAALIGSSDGARFRDFAQSLTFETLVVLANRHLMELHPRFELKRTHGRDLALQVIDHDMADEVRGVHSLSGGERFLVSLALALGLASMSSAEGVKVESLFIDEGFGALDSQSLNLAIAALERLHATGRQIGIISHLDVLQERAGVQIQVTPERAGRSRVEVVSA
jgi:exonuclease SbcC